MTTSAALFNPSTQPGLFAAQAAPIGSPSGSAGGSTGGTGAISGGLLRPGSIDQATFQQMLAQQQQNRQAAGVGGKPVAMPVQSFQSTIPTLSSAQFAALVGSQEESTPAQIAAQQAVAAQQVQPVVAARAAATAPALRLSGAAPKPAATSTAPAGNTPADTDTPTISRGDAPTITRAPQPQQVAAVEPADGGDVPQITRKSTQTAAAATAAESGNTPAEDASETASQSDASKGDPNVVHLKSPPDKDQQKDLRMQNKRWVVDETPGARQLFFGEDGKFGWDDFLDIINPLQHIPIISQIYRAVTGDEANGISDLVGAIPAGPLGGLSLIASAIDLALKDTTGKDIGGNLEAMVFGDDKQPKTHGAPVPAGMADASGNSDGDSAAALQTATRDASATHADCRA